MEGLLKAIPELYAGSMGGRNSVKDALLGIVARLIPVEVVTYDELVEGEGVRLRQFPEAPLVAPILPIFSACLHTHPIMPAFYEHRAEPAKSSDYATLTQFRDTAVYHEVYRGFAVDHQMNLFPQGKEFQNVTVTLNRGRRDFSEEEREILRQLAPHVVQAYRNAFALEESEARRDLVRRAGATLQQEAVFLNALGLPEALSERADQWLSQVL